MDIQKILSAFNDNTPEAQKIQHLLEGVPQSIVSEFACEVNKFVLSGHFLRDGRDVQKSMFAAMLAEYKLENLNTPEGANLNTTDHFAQIAEFVSYLCMDGKHGEEAVEIKIDPESREVCVFYNGNSTGEMDCPSLMYADYITIQPRFFQDRKFWRTIEYVGQSGEVLEWKALQCGNNAENIRAQVYGKLTKHLPKVIDQIIEYENANY